MVELNLDEIERDAREADGTTWALRPAAETVKGREVGPWFIDAGGDAVGLFYRLDDARRAVATREEMLALVAEVRHLREALAHQNVRVDAPIPQTQSAVPVPTPPSDPDAINPFLAARAATRARKRAAPAPTDDE
ncbi:hypothetical protein [Roseiterribacter gracilis]|uniref:Uncharacterized protein n=1 Tax=Roseiterribacter gracilis TaxID=2812848 RepID=A0A8S8XBT2_9PROT|nr:hypothetical protein TMPK1_17690 [Rhodospirillales bacterium TMPK1]